MAKIIDRTGKGSAITTAEHDANLSTLAGKNQSITATSHTIDVDDQGEILEYSNASPIAVTLPAIASVSGSNIHTDDFTVTIKNVGAGTVTVTRSSTDTFDDGSTSISLLQYESAQIQTDSTLGVWNIIHAGKNLLGITSTVAEINEIQYRSKVNFTTTDAAGTDILTAAWFKVQTAGTSGNFRLAWNTAAGTTVFVVHRLGSTATWSSTVLTSGSPQDLTCGASVGGDVHLVDSTNSKTAFLRVNQAPGTTEIYIEANWTE